MNISGLLQIKYNFEGNMQYSQKWHTHVCLHMKSKEKPDRSYCTYLPKSHIWIKVYVEKWGFIYLFVKLPVVCVDIGVIASGSCYAMNNKIFGLREYLLIFRLIL